MRKNNIKQVDVARETGVHHSTLSLWLMGKVKGHHVRVAETIESYLDSFGLEKKSLLKASFSGKKYS